MLGMINGLDLFSGKGAYMPFASKAQSRFMFANHPQIAKEFAAKTPSIKKLPEHVGKEGMRSALKSQSRKMNSKI
ncbi:MAG: hypothetical protein ACYDBV_15045 [Nitrospiria bacterium]